jgi:hypothetical protein
MPETQYRYVGNYARDVEGQTLAPGDFVKLDKQKVDDLTKELFDSGVLMELKEATAADKAALEGGEK